MSSSHSLLKQIMDPVLVENILIKMLEGDERNDSPSDYAVGKLGLGYKIDEVEDVKICFIGACCGGYLEIAKAMIERGADNLDIGMNFAVSNNHEDIELYLLENFEIDMKSYHLICLMEEKKPKKITKIVSKANLRKKKTKQRKGGNMSEKFNYKN